MISSNITGASAYAAVQGGGVQRAALQGSAVRPADGSFSTALQGAISGLSELGGTADAKAAQAMTGGGSLTDVVMAVSKAEMALQASVAVRDKVISAYQDIMRMAV
jgi:flagellar hook-basal body complex protein FliE